VPENDSTGGKVKQKGLSKKGDRYLRSLLVNGAMAVVRQAQIRPDKNPWVTKLLGRMSAKQAAIAIANNTARIAWAIMVHGGVYEAGHRAPKRSRVGTAVLTIIRRCGAGCGSERDEDTSTPLLRHKPRPTPAPQIVTAGLEPRDSAPLGAPPPPICSIFPHALCPGQRESTIGI